MSHQYALILAGGSGTRFWPLSRSSSPKQLIDFDGKGSMLQQAIARLRHFIPSQHIIILTNQVQLEEVKRQAVGIPAENIVAEPARRDTAPAVALGIALIAQRDPEANMIIVPSDSLILNNEAFGQLATEALFVASQEPALITIGIKPTWPCPSYGYIERSAVYDTLPLQFSCHEVSCFKEKPDTLTAQSYIDKGNYTWNAGIFIWNVQHVRQELAVKTPQLAGFIDALTQCDNIDAFIQEQFPLLTPISIDFALMEKADKVLNFEANFDWDDVGSWISLAQYLPVQSEAASSNTVNSAIDSKDNIVFSAQQKHVALLGVENLIVIDTPDALLLARKDRADDIKKIVDLLPPDLT